MPRITLTVSGGESANLSVSESASASLSVGEYVGGGLPYDGPYSVRPSPETQTLPTASRLMQYDVVVEPIPEYYGLIKWDGSVLRVS